VVAASGEQYEFDGGGYRAVVTECGAGLRLLEYDGEPIVLGYPEDRHAISGRGQLLLPWPNRIRDGKYTFDGRELQLPITEVARGNAIHGLTRWASWTLEEQTRHSVSLVHRLMARPGYPWTVDLHVLYDLSADGLTVTVTATNLSDRPAPYAQGAHPYLLVGDEGVDAWELTLPGDTVLEVDERKIPTGRSDVSDTDLDFRVARPLRGRAMDAAFTDLARDEHGNAEVRVHNPAADRTVVVWMDGTHQWAQAYTGDDLSEDPRRALAVEPMTAPPNAFATGEDLVVLAPAGTDGDEHSGSWGIRAL
jgi:aldose 1-epimerase